MTLALRWRPKTFEDVVGQGPVRTVLKAMVASGDLPPSLIFCGSRGTGKTTTARILSAALNCTGEMRPCQACASCEAVAATNSIDVLEIDAASNGLVDDIRKLKEVLMYQTSGRWRIALLDEAHCSPYEEPVLTQNGYVPIGELDPKIHKLVSYKPSYGLTGDSSHVNAKGSPFKKGVRKYCGELFKFETEGSSTRVTPNHVMRVKLNENFYDRWVVYLMRRGNWWRIGVTDSHTKNKPSGVSRRMSREGGEVAWILGVYKTKHEAIVAEQTYQATYGIPGLCFNPSANLSLEDLAAVHDAAAPAVGIRVKTLLDDMGFLEDMPLYTRGKNDKRLWFDTAAANLKVLNGFFDMPVREEGNRFPKPLPATVNVEDFDGDVYSLDVQPYHYYISGGAVVHNSMSREAFNALLKVLEEPPDRTLFIMATTEPGKIIDTVASRSMTFEFRRISMENICKRLRHIANEEGIQADDDLLTEIAQRAQGGMRDAVMLLDQCWRLKATSAAHFRDQFGIHDVSVPLMGAALEANFAEGSRIIEDHFYRVGDAAQLMTDLTLLTRDLLVIRSGGTPQGLMEREMDERRELSARAETAGLVNAMRVLWDLKTKVRHVDNDQRAAMEMAFVMVADALNRIGSSGNNGAGAPKQEERKLSFAEMQRIAANR
jgi:DNA polymerase III gamma/tau subunit